MRSVLIVDDAPDIRRLLATILETIGFDEIAESASGSDALQTLAVVPSLPDVVLLDVQMPDMDGWDTLDRIRRDTRTSAVPVLLCTVKEHPADLARAARAGADGYIVKPFSFDAVRDRVTQVLDPGYRELDVRRRTVRRWSRIATALRR